MTVEAARSEREKQKGRLSGNDGPHSDHTLPRNHCDGLSSGATVHLGERVVNDLLICGSE
jgi:hypothetical protein